MTKFLGRALIAGYPLKVVHNVFPQFAARDEHGWMQQDANECWTELLRALQTQLKVAGVQIFKSIVNNELF